MRSKVEWKLIILINCSSGVSAYLDPSMDPHPNTTANQQRMRTALEAVITRKERMVSVPSLWYQCIHVFAGFLFLF